ncbi:hypothetical protein AB5J55_42775 [Streptomyces sp. R11]|uniref:RapZ C-terminal domain-containing protein n=1 Tax=Streptomyces sp. R11 TaxID=3238625 RepID=A0AB39NBS0_9ACTN
MAYRDSEFPWIKVTTFGFDHGVPETTIGALLIDLRGTALNDPAADSALAGRDGKNPDVIQHVMESPGLFTKLERIAGQARALLDFNAQKNFTARILIGDTDGRIHAVVIADAAAAVACHSTGTVMLRCWSTSRAIPS